jgi:hypothetical protein
MKPRISKTALVLASVLAGGIATSAQAEYRARASSEQSAFARDICNDVLRIKPGFVPFDACAESLAQTLMEKSSAPMASPGTAASYAISPPERTSYSESNPEERRRKEEYACTRLGIAPGMTGFGQCVAQLDSALRSTEHSD